MACSYGGLTITRPPLRPLDLNLIWLLIGIRDVRAHGQRWAYQELVWPLHNSRVFRQRLWLMAAQKSSWGCSKRLAWLLRELEKERAPVAFWDCVPLLLTIVNCVELLLYFVCVFSVLSVPSSANNLSNLPLTSIPVFSCVWFMWLWLPQSDFKKNVVKNVDICLFVCFFFFI